MSSAAAALRVLEKSEEPLHFKEITKRIISEGLWRTTGRTPENTVDRDLSEDINQLGCKSRFCRVGLGMYAANTKSVRLLQAIMGRECGLALHGTLADWQKSGFHLGTEVHVQADLACVIAAWPKMDESAKEQILGTIKDGIQGTSAHSQV